MGIEHLTGLAFSQKEIEIANKDGEIKKYIIKEMNARDASVYESSLYKFVGETVKYDASKAKLNLVRYTLCNEDGSRVFALKDMGISEQLPAHIVDKIFKIASDLNGLEDEVTEKN